MKVFVYGSLKRGFGNHILLNHEGAVFLGEASTEQPFSLLSLGGFPGVFKEMVDREVYGHVLGELYEVDERTASRLDRLEGYPHFYDREEFTVHTQGEEHTAWMYFLGTPDEYIQRPYYRNGIRLSEGAVSWEGR